MAFHSDHPAAVGVPKWQFDQSSYSCDDASQPVLRRQREDMIDLFESQIRGDFDQQRFAIVHLLNRSEKLPDRCFSCNLRKSGVFGELTFRTK